MCLFYRFLLLLLLIELTISDARKVKRKENYLSVPPIPSPSVAQSTHTSPTASEHGHQPYEFEEINPKEYEHPPPPPHPGQNHHPNHHNYHTQIQRYEKDVIGLHTATSGGGSFLVDNGLRSIAAGTAITALKGKEDLLHRLEDQSVEAHKSLQGELAQLQQSKRAAKTAQYSAQQAINHISVLTAALNNAQTASELAQKSASEAATELASQIDMVAQAKSKLEHLEAQLYAARLDYEELKEAAEKATLSAQEAQLNANDAGVHAGVELSQTVALTHSLTHDKQDQIYPEASSIQETKRDFPKRNRNRRRNHKNE